jgi:hypothetical protein
MIYQVRITECLSRIVEVEASSEEYAINKAHSEYVDGEIVLDARDFDDVEFEIYND